MENPSNQSQNHWNGTSSSFRLPKVHGIWHALAAHTLVQPPKRCRRKHSGKGSSMILSQHIFQVSNLFIFLGLGYIRLCTSREISGRKRNVHSSFAACHLPWHWVSSELKWGHPYPKAACHWEKTSEMCDTSKPQTQKRDGFHCFSALKFKMDNQKRWKRTIKKNTAHIKVFGNDESCG